MWPLGLLHLRAAIVAFSLVDIVAILIAGALILRTFDLPLRSLPGAITLFVLMASMPVQTTLFNGNVNGLIVLLFSGCLALGARQRWARTAICLGASLAIKPIVLPFLLVPVLFRRWRALFISVAVPVALSLAVRPFLKDGASFITGVIPWILAETGRPIRCTVSRWQVPKQPWAYRGWSCGLFALWCWRSSPAWCGGAS